MLWHVLIYRAGDSHFSCDLTFMLCAILRANQCQPRRSLIKDIEKPLAIMIARGLCRLITLKQQELVVLLPSS